MPRKKVYRVDPHKDPLGFYEQVLVPKALIGFNEILSTRVPRGHKQWVRSLTIKRACATSVVNTYIGLKQLGLQNQNTDLLGQILERIKQHDADKDNHELLSDADKRKLAGLPLIEGRARVAARVAEEEETEEAEAAD